MIKMEQELYIEDGGIVDLMYANVFEKISVLS